MPLATAWLVVACESEACDTCDTDDFTAAPPAAHLLTTAASEGLDFEVEYARYDAIAYVDEDTDGAFTHDTDTVLALSGAPIHAQLVVYTRPTGFLAAIVAEAWGMGWQLHDPTAGPGPLSWQDGILLEQPMLF